MRIVGGYQNTKHNGEDLELTPYLFFVTPKTEIIKVYGLGLCWLHQSIYLGIAFNLPKHYKGFNNHTKRDKP